MEYRHLVVGLLSCLPSAQDIVRLHAGGAGDRLGYATAIADIDQDGYRDIVAGAYEEWTSPPGTGYLVVFSGRTGLEMIAPATRNTANPVTMRWRPPVDKCGSAVGVGDINGDGHLDVVVGAPLFRSPRWHGGVHAYSGLTGQHILAASLPGVELGWSSIVCLDLDGDRRDDVVTGGAIPWGGHVFAFSSANPAQPLVGISSPTFEDRYGHAMAIGSDHDGDGVPEIFISAPADTGTRRGAGSHVDVVSFGPRGRRPDGSGTVLHSWTGTNTGCFGYHLCAVADRDNDGLKDILVGSPQRWSSVNDSAVYLISSRTGQVLLSVQPFAGDSARLGHALSMVGDFNRDGVDDFATQSTIRSGVDGSVLYAIDGRRIARRTFGWADTNFGGYGNLGDIDQDGVPELLAWTEDVTGNGELYVLSLAATTRTVGQGCGAFTMAYGNLPRIGGNLEIRLTNGFVGGVGILYLAASLRPTSIEVAPGCPWHLQEFFVGSQPFVGTSATSRLPIPAGEDLHGIRFHAQALAVDPLTSSIRTSNRGEMRIGL